MQKISFAGKRLAIIGGGPGGLTLARLLQQQGAQVTVYERDANPHVRQQGATLDLHYESGLKALRLAGLMDEFKNTFRPGAERMTVTDNNVVIQYTERNALPLQFLDAENARPEIDRGPLRDLLLSSLKPGTVVWNANFTAMQRRESGWNLEFESNSYAYADVVIAADGANSKVRKYICDIPHIYSGATIVEGNIYHAEFNAPQLWNLTAGGKVFALWKGKSIVLSAKGEGSLSFYTSTLEPEDLAKTYDIDFTVKEQVANWFKIRFADWSYDWHELFESNDLYTIARPQYYFPSSQTWETLPNLTMIGDAAHVSPPYGEVVNQAMLDALELSETLFGEAFSTIEEAIGAFEKKMVTRSSIVTVESLQMLENLHSDNNLRFMVDFFENNR